MDQSGSPSPEISFVINSMYRAALRLSTRDKERESERLSMDWTKAAPPAVLDPHHLPQLLPLFNCHSDWQWTQSPV